jgi:hypothetical protein
MTNETFEEKQQAGALDGWYILEIFGHQRFAGYLTVQNIGLAAMVRLDVPPLAERERVSKRPGYVGDQYCPAGTAIKEGSVQGYTKLFGVGAIYAMTPCTKEACLAAVEEIQPRPMTPISIPETKAIAAAVTTELDDDDEDPYEDSPI